MSTIRKHDGYVYVIIKSEWNDYDRPPLKEWALLGTKSEITAKNIVKEKNEEFLAENTEPMYSCEYRYQEVVLVKE